MQLRGTIDIDRPIEEVYEFVADSNNDPTWCAPVITSELVEGAAGEAGARYRQAQLASPMGKDLDVQLLHTDSPKHIQLRWSTSVITNDVVYDLEATERGTRLTQITNSSFRGMGYLGRPLARLMYPIALRMQLNKLKKTLEALG